jgi:hypothetical protein
MAQWLEQGIHKVNPNESPLFGAALQNRIFQAVHGAKLLRSFAGKKRTPLEKTVVFS